MHKQSETKWPPPDKGDKGLLSPVFPLPALTITLKFCFVDLTYSSKYMNRPIYEEITQESQLVPTRDCGLRQNVQILIISSLPQASAQCEIISVEIVPARRL